MDIWQTLDPLFAEIERVERAVQVYFSAPKYPSPPCIINHEEGNSLPLSEFIFLVPSFFGEPRAGAYFHVSEFFSSCSERQPPEMSEDQFKLRVFHIHCKEELGSGFSRCLQD